eukprot:3377266-Pyramimonas_sp.AAC.4
MDKAGAYGIQGIGGSFVKGIQGCYFSVMGFPIHRFSAEVRERRSRYIRGLLRLWRIQRNLTLDDNVTLCACFGYNTNCVCPWQRSI